MKFLMFAFLLFSLSSQATELLFCVSNSNPNKKLKLTLNFPYIDFGTAEISMKDNLVNISTGVERIKKKGKTNYYIGLKYGDDKNTAFLQISVKKTRDGKLTGDGRVHGEDLGDFKDRELVDCSSERL